MSHDIAQATLVYYPDTIASGTASGLIDLRGGTLVSLITPASLSSTTCTITVSDTPTGTFVTACDPTVSGTNTRTFNIASSKYYDFAPSVTAGMRYIKFVYGSTETAKTMKYGIRSID